MKKKTIRIKFAKIAIFILLLNYNYVLGSEVNVDVSWPDFIAKQDLLWSDIPQSWRDAPFLGNGLMGSKFFQKDRNSMIIQIGRTDVQDHRLEAGKFTVPQIAFNQGRLPIGHFTLETKGNINDCDLRLNLWDAELGGTIYTSEGTIRLVSFVHSQKMLLVFKATVSGNESVEFKWNPGKAISPRMTRKRRDNPDYMSEFIENPPPVLDKKGNIHLCIQDLLAGGQTATAWSVKKEEEGSLILYVSVGHSFPDTSAKNEASSVIQKNLNIDIEKLFASHRAWWHNFYPKSFVSIPDARMESFFWIQNYKMACATKGGMAIADNMGPWLQSTIWPALWWNLNVQLSYSHLLPANHPELSIGLVDRIFEHQDNLTKNVPDRMQKDSIAINVVSGQDLIAPLRDPLVREGMQMGNMTWAMHNCYMQYRYTMDKKLLREKIYPLLKKSINFYIHSLVEGDDGYLHLPVTRSPEYEDRAADCNYDLALLRWGCLTLIEITEILEIDDELRPKWEDILSRLVDYPKDPQEGFMIGKDVPYAKSHRHYSHLLMIYPLHTVNIEQLGSRELIKKSLLHWLSLPDKLTGYSLSGASSMFSILGDGTMAENKLQELLNICLPNTFKADASVPVLETPPAAARSILDMLLQSWGNKIRVFPAIPNKWKDASFANLRAEGGFLVSASRKNGRTEFVIIRSLAGSDCKIYTGISGELNIEGIDKDSVTRYPDGLVELKLEKNAIAKIMPKNRKVDCGLSSVESLFNKGYRWGLLNP